ncbi:50S ribosomal protein L24 [Candidatus Uhrbacteria bacterium]|nr:50S ribosomal protein L24 [Candidatus Uhrbacteria bacterium]
MKIKKGDTVKMLRGKDRGKSGKVLRALPNEERVVVEGANLLIRHRRPRRQGEKGQRIQFPRAVSVSSVIYVCPKCARSVRLGYKILENKNKVRICKKCNGEV